MDRMSITILTSEVREEQELVGLRQRTRQIAGLLGFSSRQQAEIAAAVAMVAAAALGPTGGLRVDFQVEDSSTTQVFLVTICFDGTWKGSDVQRPDEPESASPEAAARGLVDLLSVESPPGAETTVVLGKGFPPGAPAVAGDALARVARELARRSRPQSVFLEIQKQNQELFGAIKELAHLNRELEGYAHAVSHDLKGPLTDILLANELLRGKLEEQGAGGADEGIQMLVDAIKDNVKRSATLIDDLLALAEAGQVPAEVSDVDVCEVVGRVLRERAVLIEERGVKVKVDEDLGMLAASPTHVYQLFANLIGNAIKHNDSGTPIVEVRLLGSEPGGGAEYLVRDNGPGIPVDELDRVFVPFFKGKAGDTGIGLAIVQKIVELYRGEVEAFNDGGACFRFILRSLSA